MRVKSFLLFLLGIVTAVIIAALAVVLFLGKNLTDAPRMKNVVKEVSPRGKDSETVLLKGRFVMPPELTLYKPGVGKARFVLSYGQNLQKYIELRNNMVGPRFPVSFETQITKDRLDEIIKESRGSAMIAAAYAPFPKNDFPAYMFFEPSAAGVLKVEVASLSGRKEIDFGDISFMKVYPQAAADNCKSEKTLLSGVIEPPANYPLSLKETSFALVVYPENAVTATLPADRPSSDFDNYVLHSELVSFAKGPLQVSLPWKRPPTSILHLVFVPCRNREALRACAERGFPFFRALESSDPVLFAKSLNLEAPICGTENFHGRAYAIQQPKGHAR